MLLKDASRKPPAQVMEACGLAQSSPLERTSMHTEAGLVRSPL